MRTLNTTIIGNIRTHQKMRDHRKKIIRGSRNGEIARRK